MVSRMKEKYVVAYGGCTILPAGLLWSGVCIVSPVAYLFSRSSWFWLFGLVWFVCVRGESSGHRLPFGMS